MLTLEEFLEKNLMGCFSHEHDLHLENCVNLKKIQKTYDNIGDILNSVSLQPSDKVSFLKKAYKDNKAFLSYDYIRMKTLSLGSLIKKNKEILQTESEFSSEYYRGEFDGIYSSARSNIHVIRKDLKVCNYVIRLMNAVWINSECYVDHSAIELETMIKYERERTSAREEYFVNLFASVMFNFMFTLPNYRYIAYHSKEYRIKEDAMFFSIFHERFPRLI